PDQWWHGHDRAVAVGGRAEIEAAETEIDIATFSLLTAAGLPRHPVHPHATGRARGMRVTCTTGPSGRVPGHRLPGQNGPMASISPIPAWSMSEGAARAREQFIASFGSGGSA